MRRQLHLVLIGLGAFLLVAAFMLRFYAYPKLAVAPIDQNSVTSLSATDATIFDIASLQPITTDLSVEVRTVGDKAASEKAGDDTRVWVSTTSVRSADGQVRTRTADRAAFDTVSGAAVAYDDQWRETTEGERTPVTRKGQVFKFPFATEKKDYLFWDGTLNDATDAVYRKTDKLEGLTVYLFEQEIPDTVVGTRELPGAIFGSDEPAVEAEVHYSNTKTMTVEPQTGAIMDRTEEQNTYFSYDGTDVPATQADLSFTDKEIEEMIETVESDANQLAGLRGLYPILAGVAGLVLLGLGGLLWARSRQQA